MKNIKIMKQITASIFFILASNSFCYSQVENISNTDLQSLVKVIKDAFGIELIEVPSGILEEEATRDNIHAIDYHIESFYMGKHEITQKQWEAVMGEYPVVFDWDAHAKHNAFLFEDGIDRMKEIATNTGFIGDDLPVETISWDDIQVFLKKLSELTGDYYRLPTNAEWEYAFRAGTETNYYFGDDTLLLTEYEWYDENSDGKTHPVGMKKPNPWGFYDMGGNVAEWTLTMSDMDVYRRLYPNRNWPVAKRRVYRGSHYLHTKFAAAVYWGHSFHQVYPHNCVGFRVVREKR